jgi:hypothetical protein
MKAQEKKARRHPPWWCRAALGAAVWPRPEFYDYSLKLHREYLRRLRDKGLREANTYARREAVNWGWVAGWRVFRAVMFFRTAE